VVVVIVKNSVLVWWLTSSVVDYVILYQIRNFYFVSLSILVIHYLG